MVDSFNAHPLADLDPHLEPLRPLLGKTYRGAFKNSSPEHPIIDVQFWERALNGKAVRLLHSVNEGAYGGETIFRWDDQRQKVTYHYFTTDGFMTVGTVDFHDGKIISHEVVVGSASGVKEVRGISEVIQPDLLKVTTEYLKADTWQVGREVIYHHDYNSRVVFK